MEPALASWLTATGLDLYTATFEAAGYLVCEDIRAFSEFDARCVAEEEMQMAPEHIEVFVAEHAQCGAAPAAGGADAEASDEEAVPDTPQARATVQATFGFPSQPARMLLEFCDWRVLGTMCICNTSWRKLTLRHLGSHTNANDGKWIVCLRHAALARDYESMSQLITVVKRSSLRDAPEVGLARQVQAEMVREQAALDEVVKAVANGMNDIVAQQAYEEATLCGLGDHPQARRLHAIVYGRKTGDTSEAASVWRSKAGFHMDGSGGGGV